MYRIGIDLGGTNIAAGLVNEQFEIVEKDSLPTLAERPGEAIVADIATLCKRLCTAAGITQQQVCSIGIASPGIVDDESGHVIYANNLRFRNFPIIPLLREQVEVGEIHIENDANAAAWGEAIAGAARGSKSTVMITLGTGVGGGIISDGKVFKGFNSAAGELGHIVIAVDGRPCTCGRRGCIEAYCSANALIRQAQRAAEADPASLMNQLCGGDLANMNGKIPFDAAQAGDKTAQAVIDQYLVWLGEAITDMVNIFRPQVVLISGGVCAQGEVLTTPLTEYVQENAFAGRRIPTPPVRIASLGSDAGLIGAACLVS